MPPLLTKGAPETGKETLKIKRGNDAVDGRVQQIFEAIAKRAYEIFKGNGQGFGHDLDDWFKAESELLQPIQVAVQEKGGHIKVRAEVPGFSADEIYLYLEPRKLMISGKKEKKTAEKKDSAAYSEQSSMQFLRVLELPANADLSKAASATLKNGLLELKIPKAAEPKKVPVS